MVGKTTVGNMLIRTKVKITRRSKYNAKRTEFNGVVYDSKAEAKFAGQLELLKNAVGPDRVVSIERQPKFQIHINGQLVCTYIADFRVKYADGRTVIYDVKGVRTDV